MTMQLLCFTDCTFVQILAVSVLLPLSESVCTQCIFANVYNSQHGKLKPMLFFCLSLHLCLNYACLISIKILCTDSYIDVHVHVCIFQGLIFNYMPSHEQITSKVIYLKKKRKENQFLKKYKACPEVRTHHQTWQLYALSTTLIGTVIKS